MTTVSKRHPAKVVQGSDDVSALKRQTCRMLLETKSHPTQTIEQLPEIVRSRRRGVAVGEQRLQLLSASWPSLAQRKEEQ